MFCWMLIMMRIHNTLKKMSLRTLCLFTQRVWLFCPPDQRRSCVVWLFCPLRAAMAPRNMAFWFLCQMLNNVRDSLPEEIFFTQLGKQIFATSDGTKTTRAGRRRERTSDKGWHRWIRRCNTQRWFSGWITYWQSTICITVGNICWTGHVFGNSLRPVATNTCSMSCGRWRWQSRRGCGTCLETVAAGLFGSCVCDAGPGSIRACTSVACCNMSSWLFFHCWSCKLNTSWSESGLPKKGRMQNLITSDGRMIRTLPRLANVNRPWCCPKSKRFFSLNAWFLTWSAWISLTLYSRSWPRRHFMITMTTFSIQGFFCRWPSRQVLIEECLDGFKICFRMAAFCLKLRAKYFCMITGFLLCSNWCKNFLRDVLCALRGPCATLGAVS